MRAPSEAGANKLDNPTQVKSNQQPGTESCVRGGNELCEAKRMAVSQPQCVSVKAMSPEIVNVPIGPKFSCARSQYRYVR